MKSVIADLCQAMDRAKIAGLTDEEVERVEIKRDLVIKLSSALLEFCDEHPNKVRSTDILEALAVWMGVSIKRTYTSDQDRIITSVRIVNLLIDTALDITPRPKA